MSTINMSDKIDFSIAGKNVVIVGGTAGIGLAVAEHFAYSGAKVVITGRRDNGQNIAASINASFTKMDVSSPASVQQAMLDISVHFNDKIDVLILNAGVDIEVGMIGDVDITKFKQLFDTNVFGLVDVLNQAIAKLRKPSSVIITSSPAGIKQAPGMSAYGASKSALNYLTKSFAGELGLDGIRVNAVLPGLVESEMTGSSGSAEFIRTLTLTACYRKAYEIVGTFQFLASSASSPITAAIIAADDGISAGISINTSTAIINSLSNDE